jgi:hypothetical protein
MSHNFCSSTNENLLPTNHCRERSWGGEANIEYRHKQGVLFGADGNTAWSDVATTTERKAKYVILHAGHNSGVSVQPAPRMTAVVMIAFDFASVSYPAATV